MTDEKFTCEFCGKTFKDKSGLAGHMYHKHPEMGKDSATPDTATTAPVPVKRGQAPLEQLVEKLRLPLIVDGQAKVFDAGVEYGIRSVLVGVRVAQELSAMGVQQAVPIIKMAQEMREAEGQAAKIIAAELAEATLEGNKDLKAALGQLGERMTAASPNPFASMMAGVMQPVLGQVMQKVMGSFLGQAAPASAPSPAGQGQPTSEKPLEQERKTGISYHSLDELEERE